MNVFLSYSAANEKTGRRLSESLAGHDFTVVTDAEARRGNRDWHRRIEEAVRSAPGIVLLMGPRDPDEVQDFSWRAALEAMWSDESKQLIPVLLRREKLPAFLRSSVVKPVRIDNLRGFDAAVRNIVPRLRRVERRPSYSIEEVGPPNEPVSVSGTDYPGPALEEDQRERRARLRKIRRLAPQLR